MPDPMNAVLGRLGYTRRDDQADKTVALRDDAPAPALYPQVVMIQGHSARESWIRDHAGQLLVGAGVAVLGLAAIAVVALVAIAMAVAAVTCVTALAIVAAASPVSRSTRRVHRRE